MAILKDSRVQTKESLLPRVLIALNFLGRFYGLVDHGV